MLPGSLLKNLARHLVIGTDLAVEEGNLAVDSPGEDTLAEDNPVEDILVEDNPEVGNPVEDNPVEDSLGEDNPEEDSLHIKGQNSFQSI